MSPLSGPQQKFAEGIAGGLNGTKAYMAAYPDCSCNSARVLAVRQLANVNIQAEIERLRGSVEQAFIMSRVEWLHQLASIAEEAHEAGDYSAAKGALREIGLAMPKWYAPEEVAGAVEVVIRRAWRKE